MPKFMKISTKFMQTLYIPLENGPELVWLFKALADSPFNGVYSHIQLTLFRYNKKWQAKPGLRKCKENQLLFYIASYQVNLCCYSGYLTFPL